MGKKLNLKGKRSGKLVAMRPVGKDRYNRVIWECVCDCGGTKRVTSTSLKFGQVKSCGCLRSWRKVDLKGKKFGRLTVIKEAGHSNGRRKLVLWLCKCDCGNESLVTSENLTTGHTKSCGCYNKDLTSERNKLDITGRKFGRLSVVKERGKSKSGMTKWLCKCECGNETVVAVNNLTNGHTKSCGCLSREAASNRLLKDLLGQRFGRLVVIERVGEVGSGDVKWLCKCDCGKDFITIGKRLLNGQTRSCGCLHREMVSGENSPWWIEDRSKLTSPFKGQIIKLFEFKQWRVGIYQRDDHTCQKCGVRGGNLNTHHIIPFKKIINHYSVSTIEEAKNCDLLFDIDNGVTLCEDCHRWAHSNKNMNKKFIRGLEKELTVCQN